MEKMTLEEFFALADRVAGALDVLREARGLPTREAERHDPKLWGPGPAAAILPTQLASPVLREARGSVVTNKGPIVWTDEELARKADARARVAATVPLVVDPVMAALEASDDAS